MDKFMYEIRRFEAGVFDGLIFEFELKELVSPGGVSKIERQLPDLEGRILIISGKGPAWLYCMIMRKYLCRFPVIAVYDPELQAAIIVSSHLMSFKMGDLIQLKL